MRYEGCVVNYYASDRPFIIKFDLFTYKLSIRSISYIIALTFENGPIPLHRALVLKETNKILKEP